MRAQSYRRSPRSRSSNRMLVATPGRGQYYIIRESSPYSLASMDDGLGGWGSIVKSIKKTITKAVKDVKKVAWKGTKQYVSAVANIFTLGAASKFTSIGKWGGTKTVGKVGGYVGMAMAAVAGGAVIAGAGAGAGAAAAGTTAAATTTTGAASAASGASWLSIIGGGAKTISAIAVPAMSLLKMGAGGVTTQVPGSQPSAGVVPYYVGSGGGGGGGYTYGGGGGGGYDPVTGEAIKSADMDWLPIVLIGAIGVVMLTQRR